MVIPLYSLKNCIAENDDLIAILQNKNYSIAEKPVVKEPVYMPFTELEEPVLEIEQLEEKAVARL